MNGDPVEVPPHGPPSPMSALLWAFVGLLALVYTGFLAERTALAVASALTAVASFAAAALLYLRFRRREADFDGHLRDHAGDP